MLQAPGSTPSHPSKFSLRGPKGCMSLPGPGGSVTMSLFLSSPSATWVRRANPRLRAGGALDGGAETLSHPEEEDREPVGTTPPGCYESAKWASVGGRLFVSAPRVTPNLGILSVLQFLCFSQGGDTPCSA